MTPVQAVLDAEGVGSPEAVSARVLEQIASGGFERTIEYWLERIERHLRPEDAFSRLRARQLAVAAGLFDATGSRDPDEFGQFAESHAVREAENAAVIRVMTIHKAKGLGFDIVILPELDGNRVDELDAGLAVQRALDRSVEWILRLPSKTVREHDPVLRAHVAAAEARLGYQALSLLYVAMTRAKHAMYLIAPRAGKSTSRNYLRLLAETLGEESRPIEIGGAAFTGSWSEGDPSWYMEFQRGEPEPKEDEGTPMLPGAAELRVARRNARRPSAEKQGEMQAGALFTLAASAGIEFGTRVHDLLAQVEWLDERKTPSILESRWLREGVDAEVRREVSALLREPALYEIWKKPSLGGADVWRERAFEVVDDGVWVTGIFDRVMIFSDGAGKVSRAAVVDFKTDQVPDGPEGEAVVRQRHGAQLNLYRKVVAILAGLPMAKVTAELVLTRQRKRVFIPLNAG